MHLDRQNIGSCFGLNRASISDMSVGLDHCTPLVTRGVLYKAKFGENTHKPPMHPKGSVQFSVWLASNALRQDRCVWSANGRRVCNKMQHIKITTSEAVRETTTCVISLNLRNFFISWWQTEDASFDGCSGQPWNVELINDVQQM